MTGLTPRPHDVPPEVWERRKQALYWSKVREEAIETQAIADSKLRDLYRSSDPHRQARKRGQT